MKIVMLGPVYPYKSGIAQYTGAMCTAAAAVVPGSIVQQVLPADVDTQFIRIGHPAGVLECGVDYRENGACPVIDDTFGFRTANLLMEGVAVIRQ